MTAGDVFEGKQDEDKGRNFKDPECKHGHGVGRKELEHRSHDNGDEEPTESGPVWRQDKIFAQAEDEKSERNRGDGDVGHASREKETKAVSEVVDWFEEELADIAVFDVRRDLPIVFVYGCKRVDDGNEQIIGNHLGKRVSANTGIGTFAFKDSAPDVYDGNEWNQAEEGSGQEIEPVREIVLNANIQDVPVLFHRWWATVTQRCRVARCLTNPTGLTRLTGSRTRSEKIVCEICSEHYGVARPKPPASRHEDF